jgi:hypothetical protein
MKKIFFLSILFASAAASAFAQAPYKAPGKASNKPAGKPANKLKQIKCQMTPHVRSRPHQKIEESTSLNWSGYAAVTNLKKPKTNTVSSVSATWTVPTISATPDNSYSSIWVGIDGYASGSVEQIGTEHDWANGSQQNSAWFEMYPQGSYDIQGFPVNVGDSISASVNFKGDGVFELAIYNNTQSVYTIVPSSYTTSTSAARSSAEWVVEAPATNSGILPLADFSEVSLTDCQATINGVTGAINDNKWQSDGLIMALKNGTIKAETSDLTGDGSGFSVTWNHE